MKEERQVLERWQSSGKYPEKETEVVTSANGQKELRYLKPIVLKPVCVMCHGASDGLSPGVQAKLREHYPQDQAVDFKPGDLRGAMTVRVKLAPSAKSPDDSG